MLESAEALRRCKLFVERRGWTAAQFLKEIPELKWSDSKLSRAFSNPDGIDLTKHELRLFNAFIDEYKINTDSTELVDSLGSFPDYMYFSLIRYLGHNPQTEIETKRLATGLYRLYRPSLKIPDMFTIGMFNVTLDPNTSALCVEETRKFKGSTHPDGDSTLDERPIDEVFHGYMIRKRRRYVCFQRNKNSHNPNFVMTVFNDEFLDSDENARLLSLGGVAFGTSGSRMYISKIYIERCEKGVTYDSLLNEIDYVPVKRMKPSVLKYLSLGKDEYYYVF